MNWADLKLRFRSLLQRRHIEDELEEEFRTHLALQARKNKATGIDPVEAARLARVQFGAVESLKEECRDVRGTRLIEDGVADVRYALRGFARMPALVLAVVFTIALPLGLNTALFTIFDAYVLRPVAIREPGRVYEYTWTIEMVWGIPSRGPSSRLFARALPRSRMSQPRTRCLRGLRVTRYTVNSLRPTTSEC